MSTNNLCKIIDESIASFNYWHEEFGDLSYDRMDFWSSRTGILAKKIFYKNRILGLPFAVWGLILENFLPQVQKLYGNPHREVIGDAHFALGNLNLYEMTKEQKYLSVAEKYLSYMSVNYTKGYSGYAWGYTFGWQQSAGKFWKAGTPLITITPYAFWAFEKHFLLTGNEESKKIALSIADFALYDLNEIEMPNGTFCSSYSPNSYDIIINANSYRAAVLLAAYTMNRKIEYKIAAEKNIKFILSYQGQEGQWYYEAKESKNNFIDNFHTCFVLKNLFKCYQINSQEEILSSIMRGYDYYRNNLFYPNGRPKHFAVAKYIKLRKYEMYDYAEGISLGVLLKDIIPSAFDKAILLANDLINEFQTEEGYFITRVTSLGTYHTIPYLRWPQAQLFYALTHLSLELRKKCVG